MANTADNFLVLLADREATLSYIVVKGKVKLATLLRYLPEDKYIVMNIAVLGFLRDYDDIMKEFDGNKPEGLNFGNGS